MTTITPRQALVLAGIGVAAAGGAFALDAVTKDQARQLHVDEVHTAGPLGYGHIENPAASYGLPAVGSLGTIGLAAGIAGLGVLAAVKGRTPRIAIAGAGLVLGGALGNLADRRADGQVTDMFHVTNLFNYFNVADLALTAGLGFTGVGLLSMMH